MCSQNLLSLNSRVEITLILIYRKTNIMNYKKHYDLLISTRKEMNRIKRKHDGYENHHVIPKSLGGDNSVENLVALTYKEHFIAHYLLLMIYKNLKDENIENKEHISNYRKMAYAFWNMCSGRNKINQHNNDGKNFKCSARSYAFAVESKKKLSVWVTRENKHKLICSSDLEKFIEEGWIRGKLPHSKDTREAISDTKSGLIWVNNNSEQTSIKKEELEIYIENGWKSGRLSFTDEHKHNIQQGLIDRKLSDSHKQNIRNSLKGREIGPKKEEHKKNLGKPVVIHGIEYDGLTWAANALNTTKSKIFYKLHDKEAIDCYYL